MIKLNEKESMQYDFAPLFGANGLSHAFSVVNIIKHFSSDSIQEIKLQEAVVDLAFRNVSNPEAMDKMRLLSLLKNSMLIESFWTTNPN